MLYRPSHLLGALAVAGAAALLLVPVPTPVVDLLVCLNLGSALLLLLVGLSVTRADSLSTLPGILVLTTLFRLALNVSTTRLILVQADAGRVVQAFGEFVVAGSYLVGGVVFAIVTVVQYVVIAGGAGRVAEVAARFALDALPGNQLAIDRDLEAGAIGPREAAGRRRDLETESRLYGALDGAMRFVRGDAIAGLVITGVNLAGGLAVGVLRDGQSAAGAARTYGLLTIGDGLAAQIPALLVSVAAGLVITRVADRGSPRSLPRAALAQLLESPAHLAGAGLLLVVLGLVPGLPAGPFLALGVAALALAWHLARRPRPESPAERAARLSLVVGPDLTTCLGGPERVADVMRRATAGAAAPAGLPAPPVAMRVDGTAGPDAWVLSLCRARLSGETLDPSRPEVARERLEQALVAALRPVLPDLVGVQEVSNLLDGVAEERPALVKETVPVRVELGELARLVRMLLRDGLPAGDLGPLLEALAARPSAASRDPAALARAVRPAYRRWLSVRARGDEPDAEPLLVWSLDEPLTLACEEAGRRPDADGEPRLDPALVEDLRAAAAAALPAGERSLLMTTAGALRPAQRALGPGWAHVLVLGPEDLDAAVVLEPAGTLQAPE